MGKNINAPWPRFQPTRRLNTKVNSTPSTLITTGTLIQKSSKMRGPRFPMRSATSEKVKSHLGTKVARAARTIVIKLTTSTATSKLAATETAANKLATEDPAKTAAVEAGANAETEMVPPACRC